MKYLYLTLSLIIFTHSLISQETKKIPLINVGNDLAIAINSELFTKQNFNVSPSFKTTSYISISYAKFLYNEVFFSYDQIELSNLNTIESMDFGTLFGINLLSKNNNTFNIGFGGYYRTYSENNVSQFSGYRIGLTSKIKFGIDITSGISTGLFYRNYIDLAKNNKFVSQVMLGQNTIGFSVDVQLNQIFKNFKQKKEKY